MNQFLLGVLRSLGYPALFAALAAIASAIPGVQGLPSWLPAGILVLAVGAFEHWLAAKVGYAIPAGTTLVKR